MIFLDIWSSEHCGKEKISLSMKDDHFTINTFVWNVLLNSGWKYERKERIAENVLEDERCTIY